MLMPLFVLYIFMSIRTTFFLESANPVAVQLLLQLLLLLWFLLSFLFVVLLLQLLLPLHVMLCVCSSFFLSCTTLSSDCRAAASAAAAAARHAGCVCSSIFFVLHNTHVSSTDFFFRILVEPANMKHLQCTGVY